MKPAYQWLPSLAFLPPSALTGKLTKWGRISTVDLVLNIVNPVIIVMKLLFMLQNK
jgi:hypothetical protein